MITIRTNSKVSEDGHRNSLVEESSLAFCCLHCVQAVTRVLVLSPGEEVAMMTDLQRNSDHTHLSVATLHREVEIALRERRQNRSDPLAARDTSTMG